MQKLNEGVQSLNINMWGVVFNVSGSMFDIHDNENVYINTDRIGKSESSRQGRKDEYLFANADTSKNETLTMDKASEFLKFLDENNSGGINIDTSKKNGVNKSFVHLYKKWIKEGLVSKVPNASACLRFLKDDCNLGFSCREKSYETFIRSYISETVNSK